MRTKNLTAGACALALVLGPVAPAVAFDCTVAKKPAGAGSIGTYNFVTDEFTPSKSNPGDDEKSHGGFVTVTDGGDYSADTFVHAPQGVLPPAREGGSQHNCDGKGIDSLEVCSGG
ncbi:MAG: hypothetical protein QOJ89_1935 [bacterium]|jgi:hypothetical protein